MPEPRDEVPLPEQVDDAPGPEADAVAAAPIIRGESQLFRGSAAPPDEGDITVIYLDDSED